MKASSTKFKTVDEYLSAFPAGTKAILKEFRKTIRQAAPQAEELISYNIPAFTLQGRLVYYAAFKNHIGFYPVSSAIKTFQKDLSGYKTSKGTIQFPIDKPIPFGLITRIVKFRVKENLEKAKAKNK
jgi:uncharacterized protein YdhG (YjbR/CyaY superfamily)